MMTESWQALKSSTTTLAISENVYKIYHLYLGAVCTSMKYEVHMNSEFGGKFQISESLRTLILMSNKICMISTAPQPCIMFTLIRPGF